MHGQHQHLDVPLHHLDHRGGGLSLRHAVLATALLAAGGAPAHAGDGAALFKQHCAICHQDSGAGIVGLAPSLLGAHWGKLGAERHYLPTVMLKGLSGPIKVGDAPFNGSMPAFAGQLGDDELASLANHLRGLQGAGADKAYAAGDFAALRGAAGNPAATRALRKQILGE